MKLKTLICFCLITIFFIFLQATQTLSQVADIEQAKIKALATAQTRWGQAVQMNDGFTFYDNEDKPIVYMFAAFKGKGDFPTKESISSQVTAARAYRIQGERALNEAAARDDHKAMQQARQRIENGWRQMLDEENFGAVVVSAALPCQPVEAYSGLPLNFVSLIDAQEKAADLFNQDNFEKVSFLFTGPFGYYAEYENGGEKHTVNLKNLEIDEGQSFSTLENSHPENSQNSVKNERISNSLLAEIPPFEYKINGVPDYQSSQHRCAQYAAGNVLGYWDDRGWQLLITGGGSTLKGDKNCNGAGCECGFDYLCWCELASTMGYTGSGTPISNIDDGIEELCNDSYYGRNYNFQSVEMGPSTPSQQYTFIRSEIRAGRPFVYTLCYSSYSWCCGYHSVTLIGYGCDLIDSFNKSNLSANKATTAQEAWFYICHDDNTTTGTNVYLYWSNFLSTAYIHTVVPRVCFNLTGSGSDISVLKAHANFPNPFNPETEIRFEISKPSNVSITITNLKGEVVKTFELGSKEAGFHNILWAGKNESGITVTSRLYLYTIKAGNSRSLGKMLLVR